jgi:hypothetical protein
MPFEKIFPVILIGLQIVASILYIFAKDYNKAGYFASGASITAFATFRK